METNLTGIRENIYQFSVLVAVNAGVGAMVGMERAVLPTLGDSEFGLTAQTAVLSFIAVFGITKAVTNLAAGRLADRWGRKPILVVGWAVATPVPFLLAWSPSWTGILIANALLGVSQGLSWSAAVVMKMDLAGSRQRGLAMGINEFAGYLALAVSAVVSASLADRFGVRVAPFVPGMGLVVLGLLVSILWVRETIAWGVPSRIRTTTPFASLFLHTTFRHPTLSSATQAGLVNNLNDGLSWGLFPAIFLAAGLDMTAVGALVAVYPAIWGLAQLGTGGLSDRWGRRGMIASGMALQAVALVGVTLAGSWIGFALAQALLGLGTAMVYPTLLASIADHAKPEVRASALGVYRLWRDLGYAAGALFAGIVADRFGASSAILGVAFLTALSGAVVLVRYSETEPK